MITAKCNEELMIVFKITSVTVSNIICFKESHALQSNQRVQLNYTKDGILSLNFDEVFPFDSGKYSIVIQNEYGYSKYSFNLTVEGMQI